MTRPVVLFDGVCALCNGSVRFILAHERDSELRFAPLQSEAGKDLLGPDADRSEALDSIVLVTAEGERLVRSDAVIAICRHLRRPWRWGGALLSILPLGLRDWLYRFIAKRRYKWFGKLDSCQVSSAEAEARFLA